MSELDVLRALLLVSAAVAPLGTGLLGDLPRGWFFAYGVALAAVALGLLTAMSWLCAIWMIFCVGNLAAFVRGRAPSLRTAAGIASCVPFAFSLVAATWIVGGANDLRILGYGMHFSYYAALHGNVLGWMLVGAIAALATRDRPKRRVYVVAVFVCFASFLLVALGIDRLSVLKPTGVLGLTLMLPAAQLAFLSEVWTTNRAAFTAGTLSLLALVGTFVLAWQNELAVPSVDPIGGVRSMVSVHGVVNAVIVGPAFLVAVALDTREV